MNFLPHICLHQPEPISPLLKNYLNLDLFSIQPNPLYKYGETVAFHTAEEIFEIYINGIQDQNLSKKKFDWVLTLCSFCLRISDPKYSFFPAFEKYKTFVTSTYPCYGNDPEQYYQLFFLHLSQIFHNPLFLQNSTFDHFSSMVTSFSSQCDGSVPIHSYETYLVIIHVLLCGVIYLTKTSIEKENNDNMYITRAKELFQIALHVILTSKIVDPSFLNNFTEFTDIFQFKIRKFHYEWIEQLTTLHSSLFRAKDTQQTEEIEIYTKQIDFLKQRINSPDSDFQDLFETAFDKIITSYESFYNNQGLLLIRWDTNSIHDAYHQWYPHQIWEPLFKLIERGECQSTLQYTHDLLLNVLKETPENSFPTIYLRIPIYLHKFSLIYPEILKETYADIITYCSRLETLKKRGFNDEYKDDIYCYLIYIIIFILTHSKLPENISELSEQSKSSQNPQLSAILSQCTNISQLFFTPEDVDKRIITDISQEQILFLYQQLNILSQEVFPTTFLLLFSLLFLNTPQFFWFQVQQFFKYHTEIEEYTPILIMAGFAPHLFSNYDENISIENNAWQMFQKSNIQDADQYHRYLLSFYSLSEGSPFFSLDTEKGSILLSSANDTFEGVLNFLPAMLRLSLHCNGATVSLPPIGYLPKSNGDENLKYVGVDMTEFREEGAEYGENFIDDQFIISVIGKSHLVIRHALGTAVFEVENLTKKQSNTSITELPPLEDQSSPEQIDIYQSLINEISEDDPELQEAIKMDQQFFVNESPQPYTEPPRVPCVSDAHAALCDLGFIGAAANERVRTITSDSCLTELDNISPVVSFNLPVYQITEEGLISSFYSPFLNKLLDLLTIKSPVPNLPFKKDEPHVFHSSIADIHFISPILQDSSNSDSNYKIDESNLQIVNFDVSKSTLFKDQSESLKQKFKQLPQIIILLNENGTPIYNDKQIVKKYGLIIAISPVDNINDFIIDILFDPNQKLLEPFNQKFFSNKDILHFSCSKERLGQLVIMISLLYFASIPNGTLLFCDGFKLRADKIKELFGDAEQGRTNLLTAAITCGQPLFK